LSPPVAGKCFACNHKRGSAITDTRCISRSHYASLSKGGLECRELLGRGVGPHVLVLLELFDLSGFRVRNGNGYDFVVEHPSVPRGFRELLRSQRELVDAAAIELVSLGEILGRLGHAESDV